MPDNVAPTFTHFSSDGAELPREYYAAIGRALYRWSQLEATVCTLAASIQGPIWFDAVADLRGPNGFKVKNIFQQLRAVAGKRCADQSLMDDLNRAELLYSARKAFFHSMWGRVSSAEEAAVGIQEWSNSSYDNFRCVTLNEIEVFASECTAAWQSLMQTALPLFHGAPTIGVDNSDGLTKGIQAAELRDASK